MLENPPTSVCFSGKVLCEWNSCDSPSQRNSWLRSPQCVEDTAFEKALGVVCGLILVHFVIFFCFSVPLTTYVSGAAWSKLCVCWWHVKQYLPGNFRDIL